MSQHVSDASNHPTVDTTLMILVDVQGRLAELMHDSEAMLRQQGLLIEALNVLGVPIIWAEQVPDKLGPTNASLSALLTHQQAISKVSFGCCEDPNLWQAIEEQNRQHVILAGIETHVCVWQTAATLLRAGKTVHVIEDAVSSREQANKVVGLKRLYQSGALASSVEMILFELMGHAKHPHFRTISALIKAATSHS
jgi:nicotinamidase-related amidase